jgi:Transglycosylase SLT domain
MYGALGALGGWEAMALSRQAVRDMVWQEALRQDVDPNLAVRLAWQESRFNPDARSPVGARSVMQLMPGTAKDLGVDPDDVADNIRGGITYLKQQLQRFGGDARLALAAYNAGPGAVKKYGGVPPFKETQRYVQTILGGKGPPETMMAQAPRREAAPAPAQAAAGTTRPAPGAAPAEGVPEPAALAPGTTDWASLLFSDQGQAEAPGTGGPGQDWARLLFQDAAPGTEGTV